MGLIISFIVSIFLVTILNLIINKNSKYLKKGIQWQHYLIGYLFISYLIITLKLVGFPSLSEWNILLKINEPIFNPHINLVPFKERIGVTNILNIILFIPFGFLLPILWRKFCNFWTTTYYGLFFSFVIEISQLFVRSRETDINDLIMNVIGTICGWFIISIISKFLYKLTNKTVVKIHSSDFFAIKLEFYIYILIAIICTFCFNTI